MRGYRGVIKGLWVRGLNCLLPAFALWVIFWLSRIHFRVHSPQGGNRCLLEDQRLVNTCVGIFGILHTYVWVWSGANNCNIWWQSCFYQIHVPMADWGVALHDVFSHWIYAFLKFPFQFLAPLWISWLICMCNHDVASLNAAYAIK